MHETSILYRIASMHHAEHVLIGALLIAAGAWVHGYFAGRRR